jgi:crotonobetainyl-CoA:carnitine CoA-transferase CaiB-like acyl-CoA transferase
VADRSVFEDIVVLEVASGSVASSVAGMVLADNGARVLKVEPPGGDRLRAWSPSGFLVWNRGKESVTLDLRTPAARAELRALAARADVVVDALHAGRMRAWELEDADLRHDNDALVYCAIRGFDDDGPYHHLRAYEGVIAAKIGLFHHGLWGYRDGPLFLNAPVLGVSAGHLALGSIAAALVERESSGLGQRLEVSMYTAANSYDYGLSPSFQIRRRQHVDVNMPKAGGASRGIVHACSADDRWFAFMNLLPYQSRAVVQALELDDLLDDPTYASTPYFATPEIAEEYEVTLMEAMRTLDGDEIVRRMLANPDVGFEEIRSTRGAFNHPQMRHNESAIVVDDPERGPVREIAPLCTFSATPSRVRASAPRIGDNDLAANPLATRRAAAHSARPHASPGPLAGLTVLEVGYYFAMPYGVMLAASLGARVIKIEGPQGDPWRMLQSTEPEVFSAQCLQGKESVSVDLKTPEGMDVLRRLVERADAFVYSLRQDPGALGVGEDALRAINPGLVYVERPGYGTSGPYAGRPMYAHTADAVAGMYMRDAEFWLRPEMCRGRSVMELKAIQVERMVSDRMYADGHGANAVFSMLTMGLLARARHGVGQRVDSSMLHAALFGLADDFVADDLPELPSSDPEQLGLHALYRVYRASEGWIFLAAPTAEVRARLFAALAREDLAEVSTDDALAAELARVFSTRPALEWERELSALGIGCAATSDVQLQGFTSLDPGLRASGLTYEVEHPTLGPLVRCGPAARFAATPAPVGSGTVHGQNTDAVLRELGYDDAQVDDLFARGIAYRAS